MIFCQISPTKGGIYVYQNNLTFCGIPISSTLQLPRVGVSCIIQVYPEGKVALGDQEYIFHSTVTIYPGKENKTLLLYSRVALGTITFSQVLVRCRYVKIL